MMYTDKEINFEYCMKVWKKHVLEDPNSVILSDSFGNQIERQNADLISSSIFAYLKENNIGKSCFVLINLDRGIKPVLAIMGVLKAGAAFAVVESDYAKDRIDFIRQDCNAVFEINEENWHSIISTKPLDGFEEVDDHDICLNVYTSGTTGTPKGVCHEYGQLKLEMLSEQNEDGSWRETRETRWGLVAPLNFVASLKIVVHFLYSGGHLYVLDYDTVKNPRKLNAFFLKNRINETFLSPSLIRIKGSEYGPFMRFIYTGAEPANQIMVKGAKLVNTYTMSESFFTVSEFIIDHPYDSVPIGKPRFSLPVKLLRENGELAQEGECGEFCYYNPYCRGYNNNPLENELHFIDGWFHTGDLAVFENGQYILKGRSDDMVKISGNRIEPSEIESTCCNILGLKACVAKGFEKEGVVALYYAEDKLIDEKIIREKLEAFLPYYMIPSYFIKIDRLPISSSGKIVRKGLALPKIIHRADYVAPTNEFEQKLAMHFENVLAVDHIGIEDDFFALGGSSLKVMELLAEIEEDMELTPSLIFKGRTIKKIEALLQEEIINSMTPEEKEKEGRKNAYPLNDTMRWIWEPEYDGSLDFFRGMKLNTLIPAKIIEKGINKYINLNSTFNMVVRKDNSGNHVFAYSKKTPHVEVERMSEKEFVVARDNFVKPFGEEEPLIRIRCIRTPLHTYLLFHGSHMVLDGAAMHLLMEDLMKCILNKPVDPIYYFAWAFEENRRLKSPSISENRQYFKETYFDKDATVRLKVDEGCTEEGYNFTIPASVSLKAVQEYCKKEEISINLFLIAATLIALSAYNDSDENMIYWNYDNRGPKDNHAGLMIRVLFAAMNRGEIHNLRELYQSLNQQNQEMFWRCFEKDFYLDYKYGTSVMVVTYLEDWFSSDAFPKFVGSTFNLINNCPASDDSGKACVLMCSHEKGKLFATLQYGLSYNKPESANNFIAMLQYTMEEMISKNDLPDFNSWKVRH